jgi:hypothetical protein
MVAAGVIAGVLALLLYTGDETPVAAQGIGRSHR